MIDLLKENIKEDPDNQELKDTLELYEETLKGMGSKMEKGGVIDIDSDDGGYRELVYKENGNVLGTLNYYYVKDEVMSIGMDSTPYNFKNELYIEGVEVDENHRGKGIAKKLLKRVISDAKEFGIGLITLKRASGLGCAYGSEYDNYLKKIYSDVGFVETWTVEEAEKDAEKNECAMHLDMSGKFEKGGGLNPEKELVNSDCINKKFKFVEADEFMKMRKGGDIASKKVSVYQTGFTGLNFYSMNGEMWTLYTDTVNVNLPSDAIVFKASPIFLFFNKSYGIDKNEKLFIHEVIGAILPDNMEDANDILDKHHISYVTYTADSGNKEKLEAIHRLGKLNPNIFIK